MAKKKKKDIVYNVTCKHCGGAFEADHARRNDCGECEMHDDSGLITCAWRECDEQFIPTTKNHIYHSTVCRRAKEKETKAAAYQSKKKGDKKPKKITHHTKTPVVANPVMTDTDQMILEQRTPDIEVLTELYKEAQSVRNKIELFRFRKFVEENYAAGRVGLEQVLGMLPTHAQAAQPSLAAAMLQRVMRETPAVPEVDSPN